MVLPFGVTTTANGSPPTGIVYDEYRLAWATYLALRKFEDLRQRRNALRNTNQKEAIMAKRKKQSKAQKRKGATARPKARKVSKSARGKVTKRTVTRAKSKRAQ